MTPGVREQIIEERLSAYRTRMRASHATPFVCLGVGHAPGPCEGRFVVCITEDLPLAQLAEILRGLLADTEAALAGGQT